MPLTQFYLHSKLAGSSSRKKALMHQQFQRFPMLLCLVPCQITGDPGLNLPLHIYHHKLVLLLYYRV